MEKKKGKGKGEKSEPKGNVDGPAHLTAHTSLLFQLIRFDQVPLQARPKQHHQSFLSLKQRQSSLSPQQHYNSTLLGAPSFPLLCDVANHYASSLRHSLHYLHQPPPSNSSAIRNGLLHRRQSSLLLARCPGRPALLEHLVT